MLYPANDYMLQVIKRETTRCYRREVEIDHLVGETNLRQPSWLTYQVQRALRILGHTLLIIGQRLDRIETHAS